MGSIVFTGTLTLSSQLATSSKRFLEALKTHTSPGHPLIASAQKRRITSRASSIVRHMSRLARISPRVSMSDLSSSIWDVRASSESESGSGRPRTYMKPGSVVGRKLHATTL
jgi:hypothetical protein